MLSRTASEAFAQVSRALSAFDCRNGDAHAYHTDEKGLRSHYVVLGFLGEDAASVAEALAVELACVRATFPPAPMPLLYLRRNPEVTRCSDGQWQSTIRIAVPGVDWSQFRTKRDGHPLPPAMTTTLPPIY